MGAMMGIMIQTAVLVTAILAVRKLFGEKLHVYIRYGLWLPVVLRLLIPVNFIDSPGSVLRVVDAVTGKYAETSYAGGDHSSPLGNGGRDHMAIQELLLEGENESRAQELWTAGEDVIEEEEPAMAEERNDAAGEHLPVREGASVFRWIWIVGSLLVGGTLFTAHLRFRGRLYRTRQVCQAWNVRNRRGMTKPYRKLPVYRVDKLEAPCLVGVLHPAVYIGTDIRTDTDWFRYVVTHEQVHYLHGDHIWALLRAVLVMVYWFHPFVWIAASASARDGEIACDYGTVRRLGDEERLTYGEMLLDLSRKNCGRRIYSYGTMLRPGNSELKERISRLVGVNRTRLPAGIAAVVFMLVMAGCAFTGTPQKDGNIEAAGMGGASETAGDNALQEPEEPGSADADPHSDNTTGDNVVSGNESVFGRGQETEEFDPEEEITERRQLAAKKAAVSAETEWGADGPTLDYAGQSGLDGTNGSVIIFHDYFGLIVYDLTNRKIVRSLDLAAIGCQFTQGDNVCQVAVSDDGKSVWLHPRKMRYMFHYEVEKDLLWQLPIVKSFEVDLETQDLFNRYLVTEGALHDTWQSNYLYEEYKDEKGLQTAYIYLTVLGDIKLGNLQCVWDDMVFALWNEGTGESVMSDRTAGKFPYVSDNAKHDVLLTYTHPCEYDRIADSYVERVHPVTGETRVHEGIDYAAAAGTDITAAADGIVYETGYSAEYGNYVVLLHQNGDMTYYCHCQDVTVSKEEQVNRGDKIASMGSTGKSTGAHLHFALSRDGVFLDPLEYMDPPVMDP